ncbi:MAG: septum formation initiator family protein [Acutalibacteraceae bacterium]|nr:septum formation initiator family protein [Acutalibacteraceae bacterium]
MKRKPKKQKKQKSILLRIFILFVCGYFAVTLGSLWGKLNDSVEELEDLKAQLAEEENEVEELREVLNADSNIPLIEKAARERLGYIYSDEQVFVDISGD